MRAEDRSRAVSDVTKRVLSRLDDNQALEEVIAESIYNERMRLEEESAGAPRHAEDKEFWASIEHRLRRSSRRVQLDLLAEIVTRYENEIIGKFDPRVYDVVTRAIPPALGVLLNAASPKRLLTGLGDFPKLDDAVVLQGEVEHLRRLSEIGSVLLVPTHVSNLDSLIVGYSMYRLGLPPFIYGAGLNLFSNPMVGYFMRNLGAYTVDRKKTDPLYKAVLKTHATVAMELGYDEIFFPGGTRSRSGAVEAHLKLGLLGTAVDAYVHNLRRNKPNPNIYIVPATLSFQLVLEAQTLIDDFLKAVGKSRYIISDDEFSQPKKVFDFISKLLSLDSKIFFTFSRGLDPFGNTVDDNGVSLDPRGRSIDASRYVLSQGEPVSMPSRDREYTKDLADRVVESFFANNVIQSTNVTARAALAALRAKKPGRDLVRLLRTGSDYETIELRDLYVWVDALLTDLRKLAAAGRIKLDPIVRAKTADDVVADGLRHFAIFHDVPPLTRIGDVVLPKHRPLLFYYQNRLEGFGVSPEPDLPPALSSDNRTLWRT